MLRAEASIAQRENRLNSAFSRRTDFRRRLTIGVMLRRAFLTLILPTFALAQATQPDAGIYGKDSTQGVFVRDSTTAVEKFALAERMERMREWPKAADIYQEVLAGAGDRVVPSRVDKKNVIYQYTSVALSVHERLAKWPDDGIAAYRSRYEPAAATLLAQADETGVEDLGVLGRVVTLYFPTDAAKTAATRLAADYLDTGDFAASAWLTDRLWQVSSRARRGSPVDPFPFRDCPSPGRQRRRGGRSPCPAQGRPRRRDRKSERGNRRSRRRPRAAFASAEPGRREALARQLAGFFRQRGSHAFAARLSAGRRENVHDRHRRRRAATGIASAGESGIDRRTQAKSDGGHVDRHPARRRSRRDFLSG